MHPPTQRVEYNTYHKYGELAQVRIPVMVNTDSGFIVNT